MRSSGPPALSIVILCSLSRFAHPEVDPLRGAVPAAIRASIACQVAPPKLRNSPRWPRARTSPTGKSSCSDRYGLSMFGDLKNPVKTTREATPGLFRKAGDWPRSIPAGDRAGPADSKPRRVVQGAPDGKSDTEKTPALVVYLQEHDRGSAHREELAAAARRRFIDRIRPRRNSRSVSGSRTTACRTAASSASRRWSARLNKRLAKQPYKAMIYPNRDKATGQDRSQQLSDRLGILDKRRLSRRRVPARQRHPDRRAARWRALNGLSFRRSRRSPPR